MKTLILFFLLAASMYATTGTTMDETWGSNKSACSSNIATVACEQFWNTDSGSGESLVSSACGSGWNGANQVKLPHGASAPSLDTYGSFPYIPHTDTFDIFFEYCYSSTTVTGFRNFISFKNPSGSQNFYIEQSSSGSGNQYVNGATSISISVNTRHLIQYHNQTGGCYVSIDGGSHTTVTCVANDISQILLGGDTGASTADIYFGQIYINDSNFPCTSTFPPSAFADFVGLTSGTTVTNTTLGNSIHFFNGGTQSGAATYVAGGGTDVMEGANAFTQTFATSQSVCGTSFTNNSGLSLRHHVPAGTPGAYAKYSLVGSSSLKVVGYYFTPNSSNAIATAFVDQANIVGSTYFHVCSDTLSTGTACTGTGSFFKICAESTSEAYQCAVTGNGTTVWISQSCTVSGTGDGFNVYNLNPNGTVGSAILLATVNNSGCALSTTLQFGAVGSENPGVTFDSYYSGVLTCVMNCSFPLLPPTGAAGGARQISIVRNDLPVTPWPCDRKRISVFHGQFRAMRRISMIQGCVF